MVTTSMVSHGAAPLASEPSAALLALIREQLHRPTDPLTSRAVSRLRERFGDSLAAVLFYGSCLRAESVRDGLADFYALVDSYEAAYRNRILRWCSSWIPPNVFYLEDRTEEPTLRYKYAVMSLPAFERACARWFHSYVWARFAQPARLVFVRDRASEVRICKVLGDAAVRFVSEAAPLCGPGEFTSRQLWSLGLAATYACELRPERNPAALLVDVNGREFERVTEAVTVALPWLVTVAPGTYSAAMTSSVRDAARFRWRMRKWLGRLLSFLRLIKGVFTFDNAFDYVVWKIERHTGEKIAVTTSMRRHPVIYGLLLLPGLIRRGIVR